MKKLFFSGLVLIWAGSVSVEAGHLEHALFCERQYNLNEILQTTNEALGKSGTKVKLVGGNEITVGTISSPAVAFHDGKYTVCVTITAPKD
jgi:hypothetical protein